MNTHLKNKFRSNARLIYGLIHVLKDDTDNLRIDVNNSDIERLLLSLRDINETLEKIIDIVAELEYSIYLENSQK